MVANDALIILREASLTNRAFELLGELSLRAAVLERSRALREPRGRLREFEVGGEVLIAYGT